MMPTSSVRIISKPFAASAMFAFFVVLVGGLRVGEVG